MKGYNGWLIPEGIRRDLLNLYPPHFPDVIAHHITDSLGVRDTDPLPSATSGRIISLVTDGVGIEAMVVEIDGTIHRPKSGIYHITWSLNRALGYTPGKSNDLLATFGDKGISVGITIPLDPMFFPST